MKCLLPWRNRQVAFCLVLMSVIPASEVFAEPASPPHTITLGTSSSSAESSKLRSYPDSPDVAWLQATQQQAPASSSAVPQQQVPAPVGTAAAPDEQPAGVAASKPSGAAIAAAKQKRIRTYAVRTALILGAAVAIGVVVGASMASPSHAQ